MAMAKQIGDLQVGDQVYPEQVELLGDGAVLTVVGIIDGSPTSRFVIGAYRPPGSETISTVAGPYPVDSWIGIALGFGCPHCLRVSHHPADQAARWCDACGIYWPKFTTPRREKA